MLNAQQVVFLHMTTQKNVHMLYTTKENQRIPSYMQLKKSSTWPSKSHSLSFVICIIATSS
jgi:hypothetical protein